MRRVLLKIVLGGMSAILAAFIVIAWVTRTQAKMVVHHPLRKRPPLLSDPGDFGLAFEKVSARTGDGLTLYGWYIPGSNGATIMVQHGSPGGRQDGLVEAHYLNRHGYNVLLGSFRAHDESEGELISYGGNEVNDMATWHQYLLSRPEVDPERIGIFGESMGGGTGILYTAQNEDIKALATASAFAFTQETVENFIKFEANTPDWITPILANLLVYWAEKEVGLKKECLNTEEAIARIAPRPVLIIQGGEDTKISPKCGQLLYEAAGEPKDLWLVPEAGHVNFEEYRPEEYERRLVDFFDRFLMA